MLGIQLLVASIAIFGLQVSGASFASATGLTLASSDPNDGDLTVPLNKTIYLTFSADISLGTGVIEIYQNGAPDTLFASFDVSIPASELNVSNQTLEINPTTDFDPSSNYYLLIDSTAIVDAADPMNSFPGISVPITLNFTTAAAADTTAPTLSSSSPADNATAVAVASNIVLTFSENVALGTGSITIKKSSDDTTVEAFDVATSTLTTISGAVLTINPTASLANSTEYYLLIDATAVTDTAGTPNPYAGISSTTALSFTTAAAEVSTPVVTPASVSLATQSAITISVPASLEVGKTATLTVTGGAATGTNNFLSNSPTICTVTGAGVVTAVATGTCSVYAQRTASGFTTAVSADVTFKVLSAAEVKAVADAAVKAAADKAAADAAAAEAKAAADKAEAEAKAKAAAEAIAAEAARVEAVRLAGLNSVGNIKTVKGKTTISMNLADKYYGYILELQVRTVVKGKARFTTIEYFAVEREDGVVAVSTRAKIAKGQQMRILSDGKVVRTFIR